MHGKPKYSENTYPSATLSTTNTHMDWPGTDLGLTPRRRREIRRISAELWRDLMYRYENNTEMCFKVMGCEDVD
jgi:hypothetical protein